MFRLIIIYLVLINCIAFISYGIDKHKAKTGQWRIKESTLLILALCGGGFGAWLGMQVFRHKTKHWKFRILVPLFLVLWVALAIYIKSITA